MGRFLFFFSFSRVDEPHLVCPFFLHRALSLKAAEHRKQSLDDNHRNEYSSI